MNRIITLIIVLAAYLCPAKGQIIAPERATADTLRFRFRVSSIEIDMAFANNQAIWNTFKKNFTEHFADKPAKDITIDIYSGASPEGSIYHNRWLAENRGNAIRRLMRRELEGKIGNIVVHNEAKTWEDFYDVISACNEPWREEVMSILDRPATRDEKKVDAREIALRRMRGGKLWPILLEKYLAPMRSGSSAIIRLENRSDTIVIRDTVVVMTPAPAVVPVPVTNQVVVVEKPVEVPKDTVAPAPAPAPPVRDTVFIDVERHPIWILRTDLPFLAIGTLNLQGEWSLDHKDRWSINVEGMWSWFTLAHNAHANELLYGSVEVRYWLGDRTIQHTLDGLHLGFGVGGGYGDLEWMSKGYQFETFMAYINFGWQHRFGKRKQWAFDAGIGIGYMHAPYRRYHGSSIYPEGRTERYDDHLMWLETSRCNWFGPTHLNVSIGYVFSSDKATYRRAVANYRDELNSQFNDASERLEMRIAAERDSVYRSWLAMPKAERRAAQRAYDKKVKEARKEARRQAVMERRKHKEKIKNATVK